MYYEECVIDGVLHWRGTPTGTWRPCTPERLSFLLTEARTELQSEKARADAADSRIAALEAGMRAVEDRLRHAFAYMDTVDGGDAQQEAREIADELSALLNRPAEHTPA